MRTFLLHSGPGLSSYWPEVFEDSEIAGLEHFEFPLADHIDDYVTHLCQRVHGLDCALVGHSFGGNIALEAIKSGQLPHLQKLVLVNTPISYQSEQMHLEHMAKLGLEPHDPLQSFLSSSERQNETCCNLLLQILQGMDVKSLELINGTYLNNFDMTRTLSELEIPCLILSGTEDNKVPLQSHQILRDLNGSLHFEMIHEAGHFPFLLHEHKTAFLQAVRGFVA